MSVENLKPSPILKRLTPVIVLIALCWAVFAFNHLLLGDRLNQYGIRPRHIGGLLGIIWSPLLHGSLAHLVANTVPLGVLGAILCLRARNEFGLVTTAGVVLCGGLTWLIGRDVYHIGARRSIF